MGITRQHLQHYPMGENGLIFKPYYGGGVEDQERMIGLVQDTVIFQMQGGEITDSLYLPDNKNTKPLFHPLSDLKKEIEHNGEKFVPIERLKELFITNLTCSDTNIWIDQKSEAQLSILALSNIRDKLIEWHFWIHDQKYFDEGIILDINTLKK